MKLELSLLIVSLTFLSFADGSFGQNPAAGPVVREDLSKVYEAGRAAFNKGDMVRAKSAFAKVLKAKPDFDLALIYMAQIRHAEERWAARPRSQKIAEETVVSAVSLKSSTLADALEVVRRKLEVAGGGPEAGPVELLSSLTPDIESRSININVADVPMQDFVDAVAFAGGIEVSWHPRGLSVFTPASAPVKSDARLAAAKAKMKEKAASLQIPLIKFENISAADAVLWLQSKSNAINGPLVVLREPSQPISINLELRNSSLADALGSIAIIADLEMHWHAWGAGLAPKTMVASTSAAQPPDLK